MAENSDVQKRGCLVWVTERPDLDVFRKSSTFWLLGYEWEFHLFLCTISNGYKINLSKMSNKQRLQQNLTVTTFIRVERRQSCLCNVSSQCGALQTVCCFLDNSVDRALGSDIRRWTFSFQASSPLMLQVSGNKKDLSEDKCLQACLDIPPDLESLSSDFSQLLQSETFTDVRLRCGDRTISAHRSILAARSDVFTAMFRNKMAESETGTVDVTDVDSEVLDSLLKYLYSGKIPDLSEDTASGLYEAGDKYSIGALQKSCSDWMVENLTAENCLVCLVLADAHSDEEFKGRVVDFVAENLKSIKKDVWSKFNKDHAGLACSVYQKRLAPTLDEQA